MKILTVVGARPQFIKAAVVSRAIQKHNDNVSDLAQIREIIVHTGQHYDTNMSDVFFAEMRIPRPIYNLGVSASTHGAMTGQMLGRIEEVILKEKPDVVLVYGDTNSTLAGALAAVKLHVPVAHVEAGLRSFNIGMPEEVNRILTDRVSRWLFCPTEQAVRNLKREGYSATYDKDPKRIFNTGDVMLDAVLYYQRIAEPSSFTAKLIKQIGPGFYLATVHRAENTDNAERLFSIMHALDFLAQEIPVILPLHPRTAKILAAAGIVLRKVQVIEPVGYFDMLTLLNNCGCVLTDSGGLQKEAYFFRKECLTLREETEWVELLEIGSNILVGSDYDKIISAATALAGKQKKPFLPLYGSGDAGDKIVSLLANWS